MYKKLGVLTLGIIILAGAGCSLVSKDVKPKDEGKNIVVTTTTETNNIATSTVETIATSTEEIDTSDWKTYTNKEYGFSFRYPENYNFKKKLETPENIPKDVYINIKAVYWLLPEIALSVPGADFEMRVEVRENENIAGEKTAMLKSGLFSNGFHYIAQDTKFNFDSSEADILLIKSKNNNEVARYMYIEKNNLLYVIQSNYTANDMIEKQRIEAFEKNFKFIK